MVLVNLLCTIVPFLLVYVLAEFISTFYESTYNSMPGILKVCTFGTILEAVASVLKSNLLAKGKAWLLFSLRCFRDCLLVLSVYFVLVMNHGENGAILYSWTSVCVGVVFLLLLLVTFYLTSNKG